MSEIAFQKRIDKLHEEIEKFSEKLQDERDLLKAAFNAKSAEMRKMVDAITITTHSELKRGTRVQVYANPIVRTNPEGVAVVKRVIRAMPWTDIYDETVSLCLVNFEGKHGAVERQVSEIIE